MNYFDSRLVNDKRQVILMKSISQLNMIVQDIQE